MKIEINRLPPLVAARVIGAVFGVAAFVVILVGWMFSFSLPGEFTIRGMPLAIATFLIPLGWWLSTYVCTAALCSLYNVLAGHFGGVIFETSTLPGERSEA